jgi:hypothetical protein
MKLEVKINRDSAGGESVEITGDSAGLNYLSEACKRISGKRGPGARFHFEQELSNLTEGSVPLTIYYQQTDPQDRAVD